MPKAKTKLAEQLPERNTPFHVASDMEDDVRAVSRGKCLVGALTTEISVSPMLPTENSGEGVRFRKK
jgi:stress response protein YsnF